MWLPLQRCPTLKSVIHPSAAVEAGGPHRPCTPLLHPWDWRQVVCDKCRLLGLYPNGRGVTGWQALSSMPRLLPADLKPGPGWLLRATMCHLCQKVSLQGLPQPGCLQQAPPGGRQAPPEGGQGAEARSITRTGRPSLPLQPVFTPSCSQRAIPLWALCDRLDDRKQGVMQGSRPTVWAFLYLQVRSPLMDYGDCTHETLAWPSLGALRQDQCVLPGQSAAPS